jgi:hypothetical protein
MACLEEHVNTAKSNVIRLLTRLLERSSTLMRSMRALFSAIRVDMACSSSSSSSSKGEIYVAVCAYERTTMQSARSCSILHPPLLADNLRDCMLLAGQLAGKSNLACRKVKAHLLCGVQGCLGIGVVVILQVGCAHGSSVLHVQQSGKMMVKTAKSDRPISND